MKGTFVLSLVLTLCLTSLVTAQMVGSNRCLNSINPPAPAGGQANGNCTLTQSLFGQGTGPIEYWGPGGSTVICTHSGPTTGLILLAGTPVTAFFALPGLSVDIDIVTGVFAIYDAVGTGIGAPPLLPPPGATQMTIPYGMPTGVTARLLSVQGFAIDPSVPLGLSASARNDIGAQNLTALGPPETPPLVSATAVVTPIPVPAPGTPWPCGPLAAQPATGLATTSIFPYPRDTICPNIGPVGTRHSIYGTNFDATAPGATTAKLNNIPLTIHLVRPNEIIFSTTTAHEAGIAGPVRITSTGGIETKTEDQNGLWVFITPAPVSQLPQEPALTGFGGGGGGGISGTFPITPGLHAMTGVKDGNNQLDYYRISDPTGTTGLAQGTWVRIFMGQISGSDNQVITQASGLIPTGAIGPPTWGSAGTNTNVAYTTATQQWSQQWYSNQPNCLNDTWLHWGLGSDLINPGPAYVNNTADQDDGAAGTNSFFRGNPSGVGQPPFPAGMTWATATVPANDPDVVVQATGLDWIVADDFGNYYPVPGSVVPYKYIVIAYY